VAGPYHQILGEGCVYPAAVPTLGNQLSACSHPATWSADRTRHAERGDQHAARHDGFAFFPSVTANPAFYAAHILSFRPLPGDLTRASITMAFSSSRRTCATTATTPPAAWPRPTGSWPGGCRSSSPRRLTGTAD